VPIFQIRIIPKIDPDENPEGGPTPQSKGFWREAFPTTTESFKAIYKGVLKLLNGHH
jgi:hypothetical protein